MNSFEFGLVLVGFAMLLLGFVYLCEFIGRRWSSYKQRQRDTDHAVQCLWHGVSENRFDTKIATQIVNARVTVINNPVWRWQSGDILTKAGDITKLPMQHVVIKTKHGRIMLDDVDDQAEVERNLKNFRAAQAELNIQLSAQQSISEDLII